MIEPGENKKPIVGSNGQSNEAGERHKDSDFSLTPGELSNEVDSETAYQKHGILSTAKANTIMDIAAKQPIPKMLFDEFWFEGELSILFADTGVGKSLLAVQIAQSIANGENIEGFKMESPPQKVYYFDFEISEKQFQRRYSNEYTDNFIFSDNLFRGEMNPAAIPDGKTFESYLNESFEAITNDTGAKVFIIDNITRITSADTDKARTAKPMMEFLLNLKNQYKVSILALEHTRKRDESRPISLNDLQGSATKARFIDSAFTIGRSAKDGNTRYLKQLKFRNGECRWDSDNVAVCQIDKPHNFTGFTFMGFGMETEHLREVTENDKSQLIANVKALAADGRTQREIATQLDISVGTVNKYLKK